MKAILNSLFASLVILGFSTANLSAQTINAVAAIVTIAPGDTIAVPVTVENFNGVASASLVIVYDMSVVKYVGTQNINPLLTGTVLPGGIPPEYKFAWFNVLPVSLGNATLFEIQFTGIAAGSSPLSWDTITLGYNQFSDEVGNILPATFTDGRIDVMPDNDGIVGKVFLQGAYAGSGAMTTSLNTAGYLPLSQPFNTAPWNYAGTESVISFPGNVVDWIMIELRSHPDTIADRRAALLLSDGSIVDTNFNQDVIFSTPPLNSYYIVVDHRNHLPVMTADKYVVPNWPMLDLSDAATFPLYGGNLNYIQLETGVYGLCSGDINKDGILKYSGPGNDRAPILQRIVNVSGSNSITTTISGWYNEDLTMNGIVKYSGPGNDPSKIIQNIVTLTGSTSITNTFVSPVPAGN